MAREKKDGSSIFKDICPICEGSGKFDVLVQYQYSKQVSEIQSSVMCEICQGTGLIPVIQKTRKRIT